MSLSGIATDLRQRAQSAADAARASLKQSDALKRLDRDQVRVIALQAAGIWLVTRIFFLALTFIAPALLIVSSHPDINSLFPGVHAFDQNRALLFPLLDGRGPLANWIHSDASWYMVMGVRGYDTYTSSAAGFFPLYPLAIRLGTFLFGDGQVLAIGFILTNLASLAGFIGLGLLGALETGEQEGGWRLVRIVAAYPFAFYLFAPYTEGFFLAFVVFALLFARTGRWLPAALCAFLAGLTRVTAVALILPFVWEFGRQRGLWDGERWRAGARRALLRVRALFPGVVAILAVPLAVAAYMAFLLFRYGDAFLYQEAQSSQHGHVNLPLWSTAKLILTRLINAPNLEPGRVLLYIDVASLVLFAVLTFIGWKRLPFMYTLYMLTTLYLLASVPVPRETQIVTSAGRYMLAAIPAFLLVSGWLKRRPTLELIVLGGGFFFQAVFAIAYFHGIFIE